MSGSTPELNLATAVDSDDNADYLTINLADSLRTVDALFNNVTGHNHNGAHQGGAVAPAAGSITSGMIADGTIVAADIANATITNAKLATDTARANLLTNGGFEIWQRGNGPFTTNGFPTADRWFNGVLAGGSTTFSCSKETSIVSAGSLASMKVVGTYDGSHLIYVRAVQPLTDGYQLRGMTLSFAVDVYCSVTNGANVRFFSNGTAPPDVRSARNTVVNGWQRLTATITAAADATIVYADIEMNASGTFYFDNAMVVVGSVPADYAPLHPADDLARCQRYYETVGIDGEWIISGIAQAGGTVYQVNPLKAVKPVTPTVTKVGTFNVTNCAQPSSGDVMGKYAFRNPLNVSAAGAYNTSSLASSAYWTIEANP